MSIFSNKTKIVCTVGPACNTKEGLRNLIANGADVFRLNFSHGTHEIHKNVIKLVRELNEELGTHIALLQDLQGPKIRVEEVENNGVEIVEGETIIITTDTIVGTKTRVSTGYKQFVQDVEVGDMVMVDDGKLELKVESKTATDVTCRIIYGGLLKSRKGINLPDTNVTAPSLTEKDAEDLVFGLENDVDWVALSFVRTAEDLRDIQKIIADAGKKTKVIAKIEKPQAVLNIDEIIEVTDGLMVARGDLGVEMAMEEVPVIQKMLVRKCNAAGKPVIVATQMMESMIDNPRPTRAETNDVANAVIDGADAVMLSAETASGKYPNLAVMGMSKIIQKVEANTKSVYNKGFDGLSRESEEYLSNSVIASACILGRDTEAKAICALTSSGYSAFRAAHHRPNAPIFIFTRNKPLLTQLTLLWGVQPVFFERTKATDETIEEVRDILVDKFKLQKGDTFITIASLPLNMRKKSNMIKITQVE